MNYSQTEIDLFSAAYVPDWPAQLQSLSGIALPESWTFRNVDIDKLLKENYILEKYIFAVFRYQMIASQNVPYQELSDQYFHIRSGYACFNTGLVTKRYKPIYGFLEKNDFGYNHYWRLRGFFDDTSAQMRKVTPLPLKPFFDLMPEQWSFAPNLPIRINVDHILDNTDNMDRIPESIRHFPNLHMLLETSVEIARRIIEIMPSVVVPQLYQGNVQFLLPIGLTDPKQTDLVMAVTPMKDYYLCSTCLTPHMAYCNARVLARPTTPWLTELVK